MSSVAPTHPSLPQPQTLRKAGERLSSPRDKGKDIMTQGMERFWGSAKHCQE